MMFTRWVLALAVALSIGAPSGPSLAVAPGSVADAPPAHGVGADVVTSANVSAQGATDSTPVVPVDGVDVVAGPHPQAGPSSLPTPTEESTAATTLATETAVPPTAQTPSVRGPAGDPTDGMPASLRVGTCTGDGIGVQIVPLNELAVPGGEHRGSVEAVPVATAFTRVGLPFNELLVGALVVVVYDATEPGTAVACGAIGGALDANGALSIGLRPMGESGVVGVAHLASQNSGGATGISVFVMP